MQGADAGAPLDPPFHERFRDIDGDLPGLDPWRPLHQACIRLSIQKPMDGAQMRRLAELWNGRRDVEVRLLGYAAEDLEFLGYFSDLEKLNVQVPIIKDIGGLRHVAESLKEFTLASKTARVSLKPVAACTPLESLHIQNHVRDFDALRSIHGLRYLGIPGISLPDLSDLLPFKHLRSLFLGFCKPIDLGLIGRFAELEAVNIVKMNNLRDLAALGLACNLRRIELAWLPHVASLPAFSEFNRLDEFEIEGMKSLCDITSIAAAPAIRYLALWDCKSLTPESFKCLIGHPTLKHLNFGVGRLKDNKAIAAMFPAAMVQTVNYKITPGTYLRRPTPVSARS
jgi:hypothetical protein